MSKLVARTQPGLNMGSPNPTRARKKVARPSPSQITTFIKVHTTIVLGLQTLQLNDFSKIYQLNGLKSKNKGHTNFYECCDLTKKVYLTDI